jgi:NADPH:quinone reductase-like Zn-dependent oxidoreductase
MVLGIDFAGMVVAAGKQARGYARLVMRQAGALPVASVYDESVVVEPNYRPTALAKRPPGLSAELAALD